MVISIVPCVGSFVSFVCGQSAAIVQKSAHYQSYSLASASSIAPHQLNRPHRYDFFKAQIQRGKEIKAIAAAAASNAPAEKSKGLGGKIKDAIRCFPATHATHNTDCPNLSVVYVPN
jgi:hypothetical protein